MRRVGKVSAPQRKKRNGGLPGLARFRQTPISCIGQEVGMAIDFAKTAAMVIIFGFIWRYLSARYAGTTVGGAMSFVY